MITMLRIKETTMPRSLQGPWHYYP